MADSDCIAKLPKNIFTNILVRLPVKSIIRFECVSKQWSDFIRSPDFIASHLSYSSSQNATLIFRHYNVSTAGIALLGSDQELDVSDAILMNLSCRFPKIVASCNGLICLDISLSHASDHVLWNPTTRKFRHLPKPRITYWGSSQPWIVVIGFGFHRRAKDYKLVRIVFFEKFEDEVPEIRLEIFSQNTGYWREIDLELKNMSIVIHQGQQAAVVKGRLHWMATGVGILAGRKFVVSFDMEREKFTMRGVPFSRDILPNICMKVMEYQGLLGLVAYPNTSESDRFELWIVDGITVHWMNVSAVENFPREMIPEAISWENRKIVMKNMDDGGLIFYDPDTFFDSENEVHSLPDKVAAYSYEVYKFMESLVPVKR